MAYRVLTRVVEWAAWPAFDRLARRGGPVWPGRVGRLPHIPKGAWIHAASAGEVRGIVPLARRISGTVPLLVTAHTAAGTQAAAASLPGAQVARAPFDLPGVARRAVSTAEPDFLFVAETELWPNLLESAARAGVRVAVVNGRISDRTIGRYTLVRRLTAPLLAAIDALAVQSPVDAERFISLGARREAVRVTGNMKHDVPSAETVPAELPWNEAPLVVAGSLRDGEEEMVAEALRIVSAELPGLRIVAAPRHNYLRAAVGRAFHARGFRVGFRSGGGPAVEDQVLVLDTMGELPRFYARARVALVGGTLLPFGGHNVVEPAALGIPVVHGPFVANCRIEAETLARHGASAQATTVDSLAAAFRFFLLDAGAHAEASAAALEAVRELSGATERTITFLKERGTWPGGK